MSKYDLFQKKLLQATEWAFETIDYRCHKGNKKNLKQGLPPLMGEIVVRAYNAVLRQKEIDKQNNFSKYLIEK